MTRQILNNADDQASLRSNAYPSYTSSLIREGRVIVVSFSIFLIATLSQQWRSFSYGLFSSLRLKLQLCNN